MKEQLDLHGEPGWRHDQRERPKVELPKEFADKPRLNLYWNGLAISITEGFLTRKQAYQMLRQMDQEDGREPSNIIDLDSFRTDEPPDIVA